MKQIRKIIVEHGVKMTLRVAAMTLLVLCGLAVAPDYTGAAIKGIK